ncbi:MAG: hypothetical protein JKY65_01415, partial [Planctomycetes bacterium]|nr:hypothetical protein [Planctomycetota bacterium]
DGRLVVDEQAPNPFVPPGRSCWEFGADKGVKGKADRDYEKRKENPGDLDPKESTFVFVTPRRWGGREKWVKTRKEEEFWRDVRAYDADSIAQWLELAPTVHLWLSALLGKKPEGATDLQTVWEDWLSSTEPPLGPDIVLAGRSEVVQQIHDWLRTPTDTLRLRAESRTEAVAVFAAAIQRLPQPESAIQLNQALCADSHGAIESLLVRDDPITIVCGPDSQALLERARRRGHHTVLTLGRSDGAGRTEEIPRTTLGQVEKVFGEAEEVRQRARDLARLARRSMSSLRRRLAVTPDLQRPRWAEPGEARPLALAMLAGQWDEGNGLDRDLLAAISGSPYPELQSVLLQWSRQPDPPFRQVGDVWSVVSKADAYSLLSAYLSRDDLDRLVQVALQVHGRPSARFNLDPGDRWRANLLISEPDHSNVLRRGLADTFALLGSNDPVDGPAWGSFRAHVDRFVGNLLRTANGDWRVWASLSSDLRLIAEASPQEFLDGVAGGLAGVEPALPRLFETGGDPLFTSSPHHGLVWALQVLGWSPDFLPQVAGALGRLGSARPTGNVSTDPEDALQRILLPWSPETAASVEQQLEVIDGLRSREPEVAWRLMCSMLPKLHGFASRGPRPRWRDWGESTITNDEYARLVTGVVRRLLEDAGQDPVRWCDLVDQAPQQASDHQKEIASRLAAVADDLPAEGRTRIAASLRRTISLHRRHPDAHWALPASDVDELEVLYQQVNPTEALAQCRWLFSQSPDLLDPHDDWEEQDKAITAVRREALASLIESGGTADVARLVPLVENPFALGYLLGESEQVLDLDKDNLLDLHLGLGDQPGASFARGLASSRLGAAGRDWLSAKLSAFSEEGGTEKAAALLLCARPISEGLDLVTAQDPEVSRHFWRSVNVWLLRSADHEVVVRSLLAADQPLKALHLLDALIEQQPEVELVLEALEQAVSAPPEAGTLDRRVVSSVPALFEYLWETDSEDTVRIARLEWQWLPVFPDRVLPRNLRRVLESDPSFFVSLVERCYHPRGVTNESGGHTPSEEDRAFGEHAYRVFRDWRTPPGAVGDSVDQQALLPWVRGAREALVDIGRLEVGDEKIGEMLSGSPIGEDGAWPHPAIREVIDEVLSTDLEQGIALGKFNSRGVHGCDGGASERSRAEDCRRSAQIVQARWPRTAAMLRRMAARHSDTSEREALQSELRSDLDVF